MVTWESSEKPLVNSTFDVLILNISPSIPARPWLIPSRESSRPSFYDESWKKSHLWIGIRSPMGMTLETLLSHPPLYRWWCSWLQLPSWWSTKKNYSEKKESSAQTLVVDVGVILEGLEVWFEYDFIWVFFFEWWYPQNTPKWSF